LGVENFSSNEEHDDHIDDFLCSAKNKWDMSCFHFDGNPIYDIDDDFRVKSVELFPLEQPSMYIYDSDFWQHEDDLFTDLFQLPRNDSSQHSHDDF